MECGIFNGSIWDLVPDQGSDLGPVHWELEVAAARPPGKSLNILYLSRIFHIDL